MNPAPTAAPFNLDQAQKTIGNSILHMVKASLGVQTNLEDPTVVAELWKSFQEALLAGSAACGEIKRIRGDIAQLRDTHRPQPHANPNTPGALCAACSLGGAITAWPCQPWTAANRILTHDQP